MLRLGAPQSHCPGAQAGSRWRWRGHLHKWWGSLYETLTRKDACLRQDVVQVKCLRTKVQCLKSCWLLPCISREASCISSWPQVQQSSGQAVLRKEMWSHKRKAAVLATKSTTAYQASCMGAPIGAVRCLRKPANPLVNNSNRECSDAAHRGCVEDCTMCSASGGHHTPSSRQTAGSCCERATELPI